VENPERGEAPLIVKNGRVALPGSDELVLTDIRVQGEKIHEIGKNLTADPAGEQVIDAEGMYVFPGGIDPHVHFNDPGYTEREDFSHGTMAAASGGITTVIDMPCTSIPQVTDEKNLEIKLSEIRTKAVVDYGLYGGVCAQSFSHGFPRNMENLAKTVLGFKTYFISGMESFARLNLYQFKKVLEKAREIGIPVLLHAEDHDFVSAATQAAQRDGNAPVDYYRSRPETAEILAVLAAAEIAEKTGADLHIVHVGTAKAAEVLRNRAPTCETGPHYLAFDIDDFQRLGSVLKTTPPVKSPENKKNLWDLLAGGEIDFVASDHAPCMPELKNTGSIWTDYAGIPGCPTLFPYLFSEGYMKGRLTLHRFVRLVSENAARRYGIDHKKGSIEKGKDADLVLVDPKDRTVVRGEALFSKGKLTPFEGMEFRGRIQNTFLRGALVYSLGKGVVGKKGGGKLIKRDR
jgi:allantoinase